MTYSKSNIKEEQNDLNFSICKNRKIGEENSLMYGEQTKIKKNVQGLTFNPMINEMMEDIFGFIASIEKEVIQ
jgi:hypothetical protein